MALAAFGTVRWLFRILQDTEAAKLRTLLVMAAIGIAIYLLMFWLVTTNGIDAARSLGLFLVVTIFATCAHSILALVFHFKASTLICLSMLAFSLLVDRNDPSETVAFSGYEELLRTITLDPNDRSNQWSGRWNANNGLLGDRYSAAFEEWIFDRANVAEYRNNNVPYPVFLVASEGGGGYAMAHSRTFLNAMAARCPNFYQHTFSIAGVSGGAIGNAVAYLEADFQNLPDNFGCTSGVQAKNNAGVAEDHLSPVVAFMLFVEFPRRLLFLPVAEQNRSEVLISSIFGDLESERAKRLSQPFTEHFWRYHVSDEVGRYEVRPRGAPALVSISTNVDSGNRFIFSPFRFSSEAEMSYNFYAAEPVLRGDAERRLMYFEEATFSDAIASSASFPWVTPSIRYEATEGCRMLYMEALHALCAKQEDPLVRSVNLVDGGYFEGTGIETIGEIYSSITGAVRDPYDDVSGPEHRFCDLLRAPSSCARGLAERLESNGDYSKNVEYSEDGFAEVLPVEYAFFRNPSEQYAPSFRSSSIADISECKAIAAVHTKETDRFTWPPCTIVFRVTVLVLSDENVSQSATTGQNFLLDPLKTMFATRASRGELAIERLEERICGSAHEQCSLGQFQDRNGSFSSAVQNGMIEFRIHSAALDLPLGWDMPEDSVAALNHLVVPDPSLCQHVSEWYWEEFDDANRPIYLGVDTSTYPALKMLPQPTRHTLYRNCNGISGIELILDPETLGQIDWFMWLD
ncbi:MAG: hypothetical protein ABJG80_02930 [Paracoccaceae bacterium]